MTIAGQPGHRPLNDPPATDSVGSRDGGRGTESDAKNVVYRQNCDFIWNNDKDTVFYKPSGSRADVHAYTKKANDRDDNGYITYHGLTHPPAGRGRGAGGGGGGGPGAPAPPPPGGGGLRRRADGTTGGTRGPP
ncbi:hypothetical protein EV562_1011, partial [Streptomyces sp. BK208]